MTEPTGYRETKARRTRTKLGAFSKPIIGPVKTRLETTPLAASAFNGGET